MSLEYGEIKLERDRFKIVDLGIHTGQEEGFDGRGLDLIMLRENPIEVLTNVRKDFRGYQIRAGPVYDPSNSDKVFVGRSGSMRTDDDGGLFFNFLWLK